MSDTAATVSKEVETTADAEPVAIRARGVTKRFGETTAVDDVSFSVPPGTIAEFLGPNGSGKTTLWLLLILWLVPAVSIFGLGVTVLVSMKARGFQEAQQIADVVVLPVVALLLAQVTGVRFLSTGLLFAIGALVFVLDAALVWAFEPEALLTGGS
ncbi:ATP-binding cassette domain-containing protein [Halorarius litoreus]|uniref:ATP-binding cassette domain-containing protein n=1 Tax=Halorarius litoreus TaxID=2962676 RepID=UPI0020CECCA4|nr:ATP-binding cassette domain-containing protein [Halorarius litoreus]